MRRVTVTLPDDLVEEMDRWESNRSRFVLKAAERELAARRQRELERSLRNPHQESAEIAEAGLGEWGDAGDGEEDLLDDGSARKVRWVEGKGWQEAE